MKKSRYKGVLGIFHALGTAFIGGFFLPGLLVIPIHIVLKNAGFTIISSVLLGLLICLYLFTAFIEYFGNRHNDIFFED